MRRAIEVARPTRPHPNPRVGALVLDATGKVIAAAAHEGPGLPHAEAAALQMAGSRAEGSTVVVTLEPCVHAGRTPACVRALRDAGVADVIVGALDPDSRASGQGLTTLREAGVGVYAGVLAAEIERADPAYFHHRRAGRPLVTLKMGLTLDGQVAAANGGSCWITSVEARNDAHLQRSESDAVIVGAGTVFADDPRLTVRLDDYDGPQPVPVVVGGSRPLPRGASVFAGKAVAYVPRPAELPAEVVVLPGHDGVELEAMIDDLGDRGHLALLVEGGPTLAAGLLKERLIDRGTFYVAAKLAGGAGKTPFAGLFSVVEELSDIRIEAVTDIGPDLRIDFVTS